MPTNRTVDSRTMIAAAESGQEGIRKAADRAQQESQFSREQGLRQGESLARGLQQQEQIDEQERSNLAREGLEKRGLAEQERRNRMGEAIEQDKQDMEMADRGLESKGQSRADTLRQGEAGGAQQAQLSPEQQQAQAEDEAASAQWQEQAGKPLEVNGAGRRTIAPTAERTAQEGSKLTTNRLNAQANYMNAVRNFQEAKLKGKEGGEDAMKAELKNLQQPIKEAARMFDLGKKQDLSDSQWEDIKALAAGAPDPGLQQELATKTFGPSLGRFMQARVSQASIQFMAVTGDMPDGDLVDLASPAMRQFTQNAEQMQAYLRAADANGLLSQALHIQSMADRNRMVRKLTAQAMLNQKSKPASSGGDLIPSQGGQRAQPAAGGINPRTAAGLGAGAAAGGAARGAASVGRTPRPAGANGPGSGPQLPGTPGTPRDWNRDVK